ncbi:MAG TPA: peptidase S11 [Betaproteobacteria bacterium]|jgi:serine-type D-Ala-D-Ala endopeptidase (penicillin-binding protein 7)|nr:peptidase S11 [Betaproteobacteria bacterium]
MYFRRITRSVFPAILLSSLAVFILMYDVVDVDARGSSDPRLKSRVAIVVDQTNGEVIYEKNASDLAPIASITKLMTAMVIIDSGVPLLESMTIAKSDVDRYKGSRSKLSVGTTLLRAEVLKLALMASENRASAALSRVFPGGKKAFVQAMNEKAKSLGMDQTVFVDSTGLRPGNVSSGLDLVKMVVAAYEYPLIRQYTTTSSFQLRAKIGGRSVTLEYVNSNRLVRSSRWEIGLSKTGYISESGRCLVMQTTILGKPVIMVLLESWGKLTAAGDAGRARRWMEQAKKK